jgi:Peptidase inhibitor I9
VPVLAIASSHPFYLSTNLSLPSSIFIDRTQARLINTVGESCRHLPCFPLASSRVITMKGLLLSALPLLAAGSPVFVDTIHNGAAPVVLAANAEEVPGSYMVIFKNHVSEKAAVAHQLWVKSVHDDTTTQKMELRKRSQSPMQDTVYEGLKHEYNIPGGMRGYSGHFHQDVIEQVRRHPDVSSSHFHQSRHRAVIIPADKPGRDECSSPRWL